MLSVRVSWLLSCKMFFSISMISLAWENLISHHHWGWSLTDIDALHVDGFPLIIHRVTHLSFSFLLPITFMFILLAVILKYDTDRYTEFNQRLNMEAYPLTTAYLERCLAQTDAWFGFILFVLLDNKTNEKRIICITLQYFALLLSFLYTNECK